MPDGRADGVRLCEHIEDADGAVVFRAACNMGLEGIVAKRRDSRYRSGRCRDWIKVKNIAHPAIERKMLIALANAKGSASLCATLGRRCAAPPVIYGFIPTQTPGSLLSMSLLLVASLDLSAPCWSRCSFPSADKLYLKINWRWSRTNEKLRLLWCPHYQELWSRLPAPDPPNLSDRDRFPLAAETGHRVRP